MCDRQNVEPYTSYTGVVEISDCFLLFLVVLITISLFKVNIVLLQVGNILKIFKLYEENGLSSLPNWVQIV